MNPKEFFGEAKRRNVYKVAVAYAVVGWLLIQVATQVFPFLEIPNWTIRLVILLTAFGFPVALIIAWAFELTPEGIKRTEAADAAQQRSRGGIWIAVIVVAAALSLGLFFLGRYSAGRATPQVTEAPTAVNPQKSIAVLPFENLSEEKANAFFADGVQDEILTDLSKIADLKVISRSSVMHYRSGLERNPRKIGEELGVAHVLEGSVQRAGNRIRVNAQLIDARNDTHLWAQTYDRDLSDVFAIQSEIAKTIADQLQAKLSPQEKSAIQRPPTSDIAAFDLYTRARNLWLTAWGSSTGKDDLLQAADLLNQAVARDPSFFDAWCQLAVTEVTIYFLDWDHTPVRLTKAEVAVQTAARLRPDAGETHLALGRMRYFGYLDYKGALAELELARRSIPNDPWVVLLRGYIERRQGRWDESIRDQQRGTELDPRNTLALQQLATTYEAMRRYAEAKAVLARALAFDPNDAITRAYHAFVDFEWKADTRPLQQVIASIRGTNAAAVPTIANFWLLYALAERDAVAARDALMASGANPINGISENIHFSQAFMEGLIARLMHDEAKARAAFTTARTQQEKTIQAQADYAPAVCMLGLIDAALGQKEEALREGQRAVDLLPLEKDAFGGMEIVKYFSVTAAWAGNKDLACRQLVIATSQPSALSYGQLKLLPFWDALHSDPRFEKIVASLAPKDANP
jgi:TolB-like protein